MASQELSYRLASYSIQSVYSIMLYGKFERLSTIRMARAKYLLGFDMQIVFQTLYQDGIA
eukprot:scaffold28470_cov133-Amphora_coffeaeformis.AAC.1